MAAMGEPANGIRYLEQLEAKGGSRAPEFRDVSRYIEQKARKKGIPVSGKFELTPLCNLDCRMCFIHLSPEQLKGRSVLPVPVWKDLIRQAWNAGMYMATLTGGECLTYPGFEELFLWLQSLGCEIVVMTNGVLLDDARIRFFLEHRPADIQVTLYGWNDDVYERVTGKRAFGTVSRNVTQARKAGLSVSVGVTPTVFLGEDSLETLRAAKRLSKSVVVNTGLFSPREETGRSGQTYEPDQDLYVLLITSSIVLGKMMFPLTFTMSSLRPRICVIRGYLSPLLLGVVTKAARSCVRKRKSGAPSFTRVVKVISPISPSGTGLPVCGSRISI